MTEGFHPTPRLVLALSLPLGVVGHAEVAELELTETIEPEDVLNRLRAQAPPGIEFLSARRIPLKTTARPRRAVYRITFDTPHLDLPARCAEFLAATQYWVDRARPRPRRVNIRPFVDSLKPVDGTLEITVWLAQDGSARADEVAAAVGIAAPTLIERIELELLDEVVVAEAARTPTIELQTRLMENVVSTVSLPAVPRESWGATANGPVVE